MSRIAVVGGGYTGMVAALRLAQDGHDVVLYERGDALGGLAGGLVVEGASLERAYHHLFKTDEDILALADELGVGDRLVWHDSSIGVYWDGVLYPFKGAVDLLRFRPLPLLDRVRAGMVVLYLQRTSSWERFRTVTASSWMRRASGPRVMRVIWEPLLRGKFDQYADDVAMAWLWARVHVRAQSRESGGEKLGYFDGGFSVFTTALQQRLEQLGVQVRTGAEITSLQGGDTVTVTTRDGSAEPFAGCVATIPSTVFARLVQDDEGADPAYLEALRSIHYLGARLLVFSSDQELGELYWQNVNDPDLPFLVFINHTRLVGREVYGGHAVYYIATYVPHDHPDFTGDDADVQERWFAGIRTMYPHFDVGQVRELHHLRFANAQHIVDIDYQSRIPAYRTPVDGVYLANFSQIYPEDRGTNYAVREGERIARLITAERLDP